MFTFTAPLWGDAFVLRTLSKRVGDAFYVGAGLKTLIGLTSFLFRATKSIFGVLLGLFFGDGDFLGDLVFTGNGASTFSSNFCGTFNTSSLCFGTLFPLLGVLSLTAGTSGTKARTLFWSDLPSYSGSS